MNPIDILKFIVPQDVFQWSFLVIIVGLAGFNIYCVKIGWGKVKDTKNPENPMIRRCANDKYWNSSWHNHTLNYKKDDLDAEHGTLSDLSQAVASTPEKIAEIMPGILLVFGLLGTFLGLGIALDKASDIFTGPKNLGMDQTISDLTGMMRGLGTKFKTSTWGIIGFLSFKAWATWDGFEERRLRWCVIKIKEQLDTERQQQRKDDGERTEKITNEIKTLTEQTKTSMTALIENTENHIKETKGLRTNIRAMSTAVTSFIESSAGNIRSMSDAAGTMGSSAVKLKDAIGGFKKETTDVLGNLKTNLSDTISTMSDNLRCATDGISTAVNAMSGQVKGTMGEISDVTKEASTIQAESMGMFITSSKSLAEHVNAMTGLVDKLGDDIQGGLKAVSDSRVKLGAAATSISEVANKLIEYIEAPRAH